MTYLKLTSASDSHFCEVFRLILTTLFSFCLVPPFNFIACIDLLLFEKYSWLDPTDSKVDPAESFCTFFLFFSAKILKL